MTTYSYEMEMFRATRTTLKQKVTEFTEAVTGTEELSAVVVVAPNASEVISLGGITRVKGILINAKPEGGVDNLNLLAIIENEAATGVTAQSNEIRFGSQLVVLDTAVTAISIKNLDLLNAVTVQVLMIGE